MILEHVLSTPEVLSKVPASVKRAHYRGDLDKVASALITQKTGVSAGNFSVSTALQQLGKEIYTKRAEWNMVRAGIEALRR